MLLGNSATNASSQSVYVSQVGGNSPTVAATYNNSGFGRTDYFYPFGAFEQSGYLLMLSNVNHCALKMDYANGVMGSSHVITHETLPSGTSAKAMPRNATTFFASASGSLPTVHNLTTGAKTEGWTGAVKPTAVNVSGLGYFVLNGHEYLLVPADIYGSFNTYEISNGLPQAVQMLSATDALGAADNQTFTVDFAVNVQGNDAYVYVLAPNNGIAAYKYTFTPSGQTALEQNRQGVQAVKQLTPDGLVIIVNGQTYNAAGMRIK